ncbi:hypothetical protein ATO6_02835 [Oceanicola sp. 22II-s10i]|uniref:hypothetical protein n=1 Tax=Oceanicola sp. 22II-s10i TaxID=1317116 RepID=UPI000B5209F0|nr:hypothetical protein [Oceanicola sp. 22II-s10i]OWU85850.1 hypothetical protein ATO6_02835 [Oceanicola sp. 22II-s10i]
MHAIDENTGAVVISFVAERLAAVRIKKPARPADASDGHASAGDEVDCLCCGTTFYRLKANQKFCSPRCRKQSHQVADRERNPKNSSCSPSVRRTNYIALRRARDLAEMLYSMPPGERLGFMKRLVDDARGGDAALRSILTNPHLLRASPADRHLFYRRCPASYVTISQAAHAYCKKTWGTGVVRVVRGMAEEPATGVLPHEASSSYVVEEKLGLAA